MPADLLVKFMHDYKYAFKYSAELENVKRDARAARAAVRKPASK